MNENDAGIRSKYSKNIHDVDEDVDKDEMNIIIKISINMCTTL